jgi:hypothetical protein
MMCKSQGKDMNEIDAVRDYPQVVDDFAAEKTGQDARPGGKTQDQDGAKDHKEEV